MDPLKGRKLKIKRFFFISDMKLKEEKNLANFEIFDKQ